MATASAGRKGRRHREAKQAMHQISQLCWLCGHLGALELDHEPPRKALIQQGLDPDDPRFHRPAHGTSCPCPTCGQRCNQIKGAGQRATSVRMTCEW